MLNYLLKIKDSKINTLEIYLVSGKEHTFRMSDFKMSFSEDKTVVFFESQRLTTAIKIEQIVSIVKH